MPHFFPTLQELGMPEFSVNTHRFDPYKNFKFKVKFVEGGDYIAGISKMSPPT